MHLPSAIEEVFPNAVIVEVPADCVAQIIEIMDEEIPYTAQDIADILGRDADEMRMILSEMAMDGVVEMSTYHALDPKLVQHPKNPPVWVYTKPTKEDVMRMTSLPCNVCGCTRYWRKKSWGINAGWNCTICHPQEAKCST